MSNATDSLRNLPVDDQQLLPEEKNTFNQIYTPSNENSNKNNFNTLSSELKDTALAGFLFIIFSLPLTDKLSKKILGEQSSTIVRLLAKTATFMVIFYIVKNLTYMKSKN